jgi:hypothetical protein
MFGICMNPGATAYREFPLRLDLGATKEHSNPNTLDQIRRNFFPR